MKKVMFVFGTRPEAIKMAPLIRELQKYPEDFQTKVCVTGQHRQMLDQVLEFFSITPDVDLDLMTENQTLASLTANILTGLDPILQAEDPDLVFVQGDTTTVMAGALGAFYRDAKIAHLEAGLRTGELRNPFPEEANRLIVSRLADFNFAPTIGAVGNLLAEGIPAGSCYEVGNTVIDALLTGRDILRQRDEDPLPDLLPEGKDQGQRLVLITGHRRESFGEGFENICKAIATLATDNPDVLFVYPVHLNPNVQRPVHEHLEGIDNLVLVDPVPYPTLIALLDRCYFVLTDSGGIQEEAPALGKPVVVMRDVTERMEGVDAGTAELVGTNVETIVFASQRLLDDPAAYQKMAQAVNPYGDGTSSAQIAQILREQIA